MPREAGSRIDLSTQGSSSFAMMLPQRYLAKVSSAGLRKIADFDPAGRKGHEWQRDAFTYNELIGEVGYLHNLTANLVSSCELRVVEIVPNPEGGGTTMSESDDERVLRVMDAFVGPQGGQKELKRRAAMHYQIAGESYLLGTPLKDDYDIAQGVSWEFLSTEEIRVTKDGNRQVVKRNSAGISDNGPSGGGDGFVDVDAYIARFWRPDPRYSLRADSPMKRVLPICRELVVLSEVVDSVAKSRLSSGLLFVPEELSFGPLDESEEEGNDTDDIDRFIEALIDHMRAPVEDRTSAAGLVPLVVKGAAEFGSQIKLIPLAQDLDGTYQSLREELLKRLAQGLDAPPEVIGGKGGLNHWTSYNVDADFIDKHVNPVGEAIAEFITVAYLRPMLLEYEGFSDTEVDRFRLVFDSRAITSRSDEGPAASGAWDRLALSDLAYLRANGFTDNDYPDEEERGRRLVEKLILADPVNLGPMLLPKLFPDLEPFFAQDAAAAPAEAAPAEEAPADPLDELVKGIPGAEVRRNPTEPAPVTGPSPVGAPLAQPTTQPTGEAPVGASIDNLLDRLATAADAALERALERAGNRAISKAAKVPVLRDQFKAAPRNGVLAVMKDTDFRTLGVARDELVQDAWDNFTLRGKAWVADWLIAEGESTFVAEEIATLAMKDVARHLDEWLVGSIGKEIPVGKNGLRVPYDLISEPLAAAMFRYSKLI
jgi:hypothetical protein